MRRVELSGLEGVRWLPDEPSGVGVLVLAGSSGRVDSARAELLTKMGAIAESIRWFGGPGQNDGPWEIPLELFLERVAALRSDCDRVVVMGTSFGAEAALLTGAYGPDVAAVVAFAPSDVAWAGVRQDGTMTSHWTIGGVPLPFVPFDEEWEPEDEMPAFAALYESSRRRFPERAALASIPVERIDEVVLVAGGDDQVWPSASMADSIRERRSQHALSTTVVTLAEAGHRTLLPGEPSVSGGMRMQRGGTDEADRRLGLAAWPHVERLLSR